MPRNEETSLTQTTDHLQSSFSSSSYSEKPVVPELPLRKVIQVKAYNGMVK